LRRVIAGQLLQLVLSKRQFDFRFGHTKKVPGEHFEVGEFARSDIVALILGEAVEELAARRGIRSACDSRLSVRCRTVLHAA
jgi:hypothetical protein